MHDQFHKFERTGSFLHAEGICKDCGTQITTVVLFEKLFKGKDK